MIEHIAKGEVNGIKNLIFFRPVGIKMVKIKIKIPFNPNEITGIS
jgi:hypothetical protein